MDNIRPALIPCLRSSRESTEEREIRSRTSWNIFSGRKRQEQIHFISESISYRRESFSALTCIIRTSRLTAGEEEHDLR